MRTRAKPEETEEVTEWPVGFIYFWKASPNELCGFPHCRENQSRGRDALSYRGCHQFQHFFPYKLPIIQFSHSMLHGNLLTRLLCSNALQIKVFELLHILSHLAAIAEKKHYREVSRLLQNETNPVVRWVPGKLSSKQPLLHCPGHTDTTADITCFEVAGSKGESKRLRIKTFNVIDM